MYKPGKANVVADALSRIVCSMTGTQHSAENSDDLYIQSTESPLNVFRHQVIIKKGPDKVITTNPFPGYTRITVYINEITDNSLLQVLKNNFNPSRINALLTDETIMGQLQEVYKINFGQQKLLTIRFTQKMLEDVSDEDQQWNVIRNEHHKAHRCADENKQKIFRTYFFPKLSQKVGDFIKNCQICHECKYDRSPIKFPLQETPIPKAPFQIAHIDIMFLESLHFLTYVDKFSKFAQVHPIDSRAAIDLIPAIKDLLSKYKTPDLLVMDGEKSFMTGDLINFYNLHKIEPYVTATGRSEMNGIVERFHSTLLEIYRITKTENPNIPVEDLVQLSLQKYNSSIHSSTKFTPLEIILPSPRTPEIIEKTYENLKRTQEKALKHHNKYKKSTPIQRNSEAYEKTRERLKHKNRYKKIKIANVHKSTVTTPDGRRIHKDDIKIRKI